MTRRRNPNLRSSIYKGSDGYWHGRVTVGVKDDGKADRRHVMRKSKAEVVEKVRQLEQGRDRGAVRKAGERWRVSDWLAHWINNIAVPPHVSQNAHDGYRIDVENHLTPGVGAHWLDKLAPEHLEKLYAKIQESGRSAGTANHVHRTIRNALNEAVRRGLLTRNPALLAKHPTPDEAEVKPYEVDEIKRLLQAAARGRNLARWAVALALGLRQGEALGLKWDDVDLDRGTLRIRRSRLRPRYRHGCGERCGKKPGSCPQRVRWNKDTKDTKSRAGRRTVGLPPPLIELLRKHRAEQEAERARARQLWSDEGWVFATPTGGAPIPSTDYHEWKRLLKAAGLRDARLHDARHSAATVLLILRQPERTVMSLMGWSSTSMAKRYQHVTDTIRTEVASQIGGLFWEARTKVERPQLVTVRRHSLATILPLVESGLLSNRADELDMAELEAALIDLQSALSYDASDTEGESK